MPKITLSIVSTTVINYVVPFVVYTILVAVALVQPPEGGSPLQLLMSLLVLNIGVATAFVLIFYTARNSLSERWLLYAFLWWLMFAFVEIGQAIGPAYSWPQAIAGIFAAMIYFPLSAFVVNRLLST